MTSIHYDGPDTSQQEHLSPEFHVLEDANAGHWIKEAFYSFVYVLKQWQARCQKETYENSITYLTITLLPLIVNQTDLSNLVSIYKELLQKSLCVERSALIPVHED
jgi:hypothetical protein